MAEASFPEAAAYPISPKSWGRSLSGPPILSNDGGTWSGAIMRWWRDVDPDIAQPALDHHYLTMHLGGAKRVERRGEGKVEAIDIASGALSIVPAGAAFQWNTRGPVEFAHLYLAPQAIAQMSVEEFGRGAPLCIEDRLGVSDPLLQALFLTMLEELTVMSVGSRLYIDTLLHSLMLRLLRNYAAAPAAPLRTRHSLAPARLRRVLDYIEANLTEDIALADLAAVAASSPFHFSRAFASVTGTPPYAYVVGRRIDRAKILLTNTSDPIAAVSVQCGFHSAGQFSRMFKRATGRSPLQYRP